MRRILAIARFEFFAAVRTRAFVLGVLFIPLFMVCAVLLEIVAEYRTGTAERRFAVVDDGGLYEAIERRATQHNGEPYPGDRYLPRLESRGSSTPEEHRLLLSDRVRSGDLFAFVEIPKSALEPEGSGEKIRYYSDHPTYDGLRRFLVDTLNDEIRTRRLRAAHIDAELVEKLETPVEIEHLRPPERLASAGEIRPAEPVDTLRAFGVPAGVMFLLFLVAMGSAGRLITSVLEEKMSRIGEVLLGAVTPFQLLMGKLAGTALVALVVATAYAALAVLAAFTAGHADWLDAGLFAYYFLFLTLDVLFLGALCISIGAACADLKDTQSLSTPVMLAVTMPAFLWPFVLKDPTSSFSVALSLFPPATPTIMLLRLAVPPAPPAWQVALGVVLTTLATVLAVWAASKIFRTGLLMQGKGATMREIARWIVQK
jgi:ABC-2 type transport system permease protein